MVKSCHAWHGQTWTKTFFIDVCSEDNVLRRPCPVLLYLYINLKLCSAIFIMLMSPYLISIHLFLLIESNHVLSNLISIKKKKKCPFQSFHPLLESSTLCKSQHSYAIFRSLKCFFLLLKSFFFFSFFFSLYNMRVN